MSKLFLPDGARIELHQKFKIYSNSDGTANFYTQDNPELWLGRINQNGTVLLSSKCKYSYYPPAISDVHKAVDIVLREPKQLTYCEIKRLKDLVKQYNLKSCAWK